MLPPDDGEPPRGRGVAVFGAGTSFIRMAMHDTVGNNVVFLAVANGSFLAGVYRSTNQGGAWTPMDVPAVHVGLGQADPDTSIAADPTNPDFVYIAGNTGPISRGDASQPGATDGIYGRPDAASNSFHSSDRASEQAA